MKASEGGVGIVALLLATLLLAACAAPRTGEPLRPLVVGWEQFFKLSWESGMVKGRPAVWGHILNDWGLPAKDIRLLVEALGPSGEIIGQDVAWLGTSLTPGMRAYFEVPVSQPAPTYRVSVFAFDWVLTDGPRRRHRF
jgi:hypothetical protein